MKDTDSRESVTDEGVADGIVASEGVLSRRGFVVGAAVTAGALVFGLSGCSSESEPSAADGASADAPQKLRVGTGQAGGYPWFDVDEQGNSTGYEADILRKVDELLPQYEFELESITRTTQLPELANGTIDIGAHMYEDNQERRDNYLFTDVSIATMWQEFAVIKGNTAIRNFDDLIGKRIITSPSSNSAYALEQWNEDNPDKQLEILYTSGTDVLASDLISGNADATLLDPQWIDYYTESGLELDIVTDTHFVETGVYFLFPKDGKHDQIKADVDGVLTELKDNGFIQELHEELFGYPAYFE
jgi:L-cystine transport system substrate-binding protein